MSMRKVGSIEVYELDENINQYTRKEREKIINQMFKEQYQGKQIEYLLDGEEIEGLINQTTKKNFFAYTHSGYNGENFSEYKLRQDVAFSGDYIDLIKNANYLKTIAETKTGQNKKHTDKTVWHKFLKTVFIDNQYYEMILHIREQNEKFYIHNTKIKEADGPTINSTCEKVINPTQCPASSKNTISDNEEKSNSFMENNDEKSLAWIEYSDEVYLIEEILYNYDPWNYAMYNDSRNEVCENIYTMLQDKEKKRMLIDNLNQIKMAYADKESQQEIQKGIQAAREYGEGTKQIEHNQDDR